MTCVLIACSSKKTDINGNNCRSKPALMYILQQDDTMAAFVSFCTAQHCEENILVWIAIRDFKTSCEKDPSTMLSAATEIVRRVRVFSF